ncbi:MAG TPA: hypothetical protein DCE56_03070 [Cyanobacteria bacterium UBA8553]|nr:hypothetical protein [Cyanobacteria bacterium UBA8553]
MKRTLIINMYIIMPMIIIKRKEPGNIIVYPVMVTRSITILKKISICIKIGVITQLYKNMY